MDYTFVKKHHGHFIYTHTNQTFVNPANIYQNSGNLSMFWKLLNLGHVLPVQEVSNILQKITLTHELGLASNGVQFAKVTSQTPRFDQLDERPSVYTEIFLYQI